MRSLDGVTYPALLLLCLCAILMLSFSVPVFSFNITLTLQKYANYNKFNHLLSETKLADEINRMPSATIFAINQRASLYLNDLSMDASRIILRRHIALEYIDYEMIEKLVSSNKTIELQTIYKDVNGTSDKNKIRLWMKNNNTCIVSVLDNNAYKYATLIQVKTKTPKNFSIFGVTEPIMEYMPVAPGMDLEEEVTLDAAPEIAPEKEVTLDAAPKMAPKEHMKPTVARTFPPESLNQAVETDSPTSTKIISSSLPNGASSETLIVPGVMFNFFILGLPSFAIYVRNQNTMLY